MNGLYCNWKLDHILDKNYNPDNNCGFGQKPQFISKTEKG